MAVAATAESLLEAALRYAGIGWAVFPLHSMAEGKCTCGADVCSQAKHPRTGDGFKSATTDDKKIRGWWRTWPNANIGIATGARSGVFVVDVDPGKGGDATLGLLISEHEQLPATVDALTGSGGRHVIFRHPGKHIPNSTQRLGAGLDVRGDGGYIVAAPSLHKSGALYEWQPGCAPWERELAPAPAWLLELLNPPPPPAPARVSSADSAHRRAAAYLAKVPAAISGARGHDSAWTAALAIVRGFRLTEGEAVSLLLSDYNQRCDPPWSEKEILHKVRDAAGNARVPFGYLLDAPRPGAPAPPATREPGEDDGENAPTLDAFQLEPLEDFLAREVPPTEWLIAPWLPARALVFVIAPPSGGKTLLAFDFATQAMAAGKSVVIVEEEGSEGDYQKRLRRASEAAGGVIKKRVRVSWNRALSLLDHKRMAAFVEAARGVDLIILDSLAALAAGIDENDAKEMSAVAERLHRLKAETGAAILVLHHMTKEAWKEGVRPTLASLRGHGALAARADTALALVPLDEVAGCVRFELHVVKQREAERAPVRKVEVTMTGPAATVTSEDVLPSSAANKRAAVESDVLAKIPETPEPAVSKKFLESVVRGYRATEIRAAVDRLVDARKVACTPSGRYVRTSAHTASDASGRPGTTRPASGSSPPRRGGTPDGTRVRRRDAASLAAGEKDDDEANGK